MTYLSSFYFKVYCQSYNQEMHTIEHCILIDDHNFDRWHNLHSKKDYLSALNHEQWCCPPFTIYLKNVLVPSPGDWPSWYYVKKLLVDDPTYSPLLFSFQKKDLSMSLWMPMKLLLNCGLKYLNNTFILFILCALSLWT